MRRVFYLGDWAIGLVGGLLVGNLMTASGLRVFASTVVGMIVVIAVGVVLILVIVYRIVRPRRQRIEVDERLKAVWDRSARNGLIVVYLGLLALVLAEELNATALLIVVAASLAAYFSSYCLYRYRTG